MSKKEPQFGFGRAALVVDWDSIAREIGATRRVRAVANSLRAVAVALAIRSEGKGYAYPGLDRIARDAGISRRSAINMIRALTRAGLLSVTHRRRSSSIYELDLDELRRRAYAEPEDAEQAGEQRLGSLDDAYRDRHSGESQYAAGDDMPEI